MATTGRTAATAPGTTYLRAEQVAEMLGISMDRVYRLAKDNRLPVIRQGRSVRFPRSEIEAMNRAALTNTLEHTVAQSMLSGELLDRIERVVEAAADRSVRRALADLARTTPSTPCTPSVA